MDALKSQFSLFASTNKIMMVVVILAILVCAAVFYYIKYVKPTSAFVPNKEFVNNRSGSGSNTTAQAIFFYTEWCPHCKKAKPDWFRLKNEYDGQSINNRIITFREVDCDADSATADKFDIKGYPTIKLLKDNQVIEFDAKPEYATLYEFLQTTL